MKTTTSAAEKENAQLRQTTLTMPLKGRKRTLTLVDGSELDLNAVIAEATPQVVEAMRLRILELESQLSAELPPAKRVKSNAATPADATPAASGSASTTKADDKKRKTQIKKIYDQLKKECKSDNVKFQGKSKTIKIEEIWEQTEFDALFAGKGLLIQPTPENKPKSTVTIIHFNNKQHIDDFFGDQLKELKGNVWSRGGGVTRRMGGGFFGGGGGSTFTKSVKQGPCDVEIRSMEVNYSKNGLKCTIKFDVAQIGGGGCFGWYDDDDDY